MDISNNNSGNADTDPFLTAQETRVIGSLMEKQLRELLQSLGDYSSVQR